MYVHGLIHSLLIFVAAVQISIVSFLTPIYWNYKYKAQ